ncbi:MAG TPA: A/G-specific adenine glycosylase [Steroidobacteraceae bacterium]|nr:A/G-specific adenine glycosylase [Steroidobacteraceae bacterium]
MSFAPERFAERLLAWFEIHGRHDLPWQQDPTPYRVWISEVMLQQTQVLTVIPYYRRFMARFPGAKALAAAPLDEVLHEWTGLGYYARARNLRACAQALIAHHGGEFPHELEAVMKLPGIGRSTAGAILALSRGERHPILDGNAKRVLARVFGIAGDPGSTAVIAALWARSVDCTPAVNAAAYTQAIMDLGATVCSRARPACTVCPMSTDCVAALEGRQAELPGAKQKRTRGSREATLLIAETGDDDGSLAVLVERRPLAGIWGGLWSPPQFESEFAALDWCRREIGEPDSKSQPLAPIHHAFTHFDLRLNPIRVRCRIAAVHDGDERLWYRLDRPPRVGLPQPIFKLFEQLRAADRG